ncbi:hypothetical protein B0H17DRAFT_1141751 [Mycena rosella]|uniref:Uncharacterized protein n=1 Tax=Mycena rosella TaxID=1033263 RepID=A0AAD7D2L0_MYCRO|nr:hypothetical protein B0H17DRAFT_1141751 [Mycena rosella]
MTRSPVDNNAALFCGIRIPTSKRKSKKFKKLGRSPADIPVDMEMWLVRILKAVGRISIGCESRPTIWQGHGGDKVGRDLAIVHDVETPVVGSPDTPSLLGTSCAPSPRNALQDGARAGMARGIEFTRLRRLQNAQTVFSIKLDITAFSLLALLRASRLLRFRALERRGYSHDHLPEIEGTFYLADRADVLSTIPEALAVRYDRRHYAAEERTAMELTTDKRGRKAYMAYGAYGHLVSTHGVELTGWPAGLAFQSPSALALGGSSGCTTCSGAGRVGTHGAPAGQEAQAGRVCGAAAEPPSHKGRKKSPSLAAVSDGRGTAARPRRRTAPRTIPTHALSISRRGPPRRHSPSPTHNSSDPRPYKMAGADADADTAEDNANARPNPYTRSRARRSRSRSHSSPAPAASTAAHDATKQASDADDGDARPARSCSPLHPQARQLPSGRRGAPQGPPHWGTTKNTRFERGIEPRTRKAAQGIESSSLSLRLDSSSSTHRDVGGAEADGDAEPTLDVDIDARVPAHTRLY